MNINTRQRATTGIKSSGEDHYIQWVFLVTHQQTVFCKTCNRGFTYIYQFHIVMNFRGTEAPSAKALLQK